MTACCHFQNIHKPTSLQKSLTIQLEWFSSFVFLIQPRCNFHEELKQYTSYCQDNRLRNLVNTLFPINESMWNLLKLLSIEIKLFLKKFNCIFAGDGEGLS